MIFYGSCTQNEIQLFYILNGSKVSELLNLNHAYDTICYIVQQTDLKHVTTSLLCCYILILESWFISRNWTCKEVVHSWSIINDINYYYMKTIILGLVGFSFHVNNENFKLNIVWVKTTILTLFWRNNH
jgi:hypothetical protein